MRAMEVSLCLSGAPLPGAQTRTPVAECQVSLQHRWEGQGQLPTLASRLPGWNCTKVRDSGSIWFLFSIISREGMKTIQHDILIWAGRLPWTLPLHGLLWRISQRCAHGPTVVHPGLQLRKCNWLIELSELCRHTHEEVFLQSVFRCALSNLLSHLSNLSQAVLSFLVMFSLDCNLRFPLLHYRPGFGQADLMQGKEGTGLSSHLSSYFSSALRSGWPVSGGTSGQCVQQPSWVCYPLPQCPMQLQSWCPLIHFLDIPKRLSRTNSVSSGDHWQMEGDPGRLLYSSSWQVPLKSPFLKPGKGLCDATLFTPLTTHFVN